MTKQHEKIVRAKLSELRRIKSWRDAPDFDKKIDNRMKRLEIILEYRK